MGVSIFRSPAIQERILRKVRWLLDNFENMNHQALSANLRGLFRLKVGDYRVIYSFIVAEKRIIIHKVGHNYSLFYQFIDSNGCVKIIMFISSPYFR
ncbi:MAG: type II toxin-antitoxin system RelE/ParE family toxin [Crocosphaera sp.]|nr:type II toxin-antitoxin system RelE/ParE family toxin [Crocosphaera sp.]